MPNRFSRTLFTGAFLLSFGVFGMWLAVHWPGLFGYDTFAVLNFIYIGVFDDWFSYLYLIYLRLLGQPYLSMGFVGLFQVICASALSSYAFVRLVQLGSPSRICLLSFLLFVLSPLNGAFNIYYLYDWPAAWLQVSVAASLALHLWRQKKQNASLTPRYLIALGVAIAVTVRLRSDNIALLVIVPLFLHYYFHMTRQLWLRFGTAVLATLLMVFLALPAALNINRHDIYGITAVINPLAYILYKTGHPQNQSPEAISEREVINRVFDYNMLMTNRSSYEIPAFHAGGANLRSTPEARREFYNLCVKLFVQHYDLFLKNRWRMFQATIGGKFAIYSMDELIYDYPFANEIKTKLQLKKASWFPSLAPTYKVLVETVYYGRGLSHYLFATIYLAMILGLIAVVFIRWLPCSGLATLVMACRLPIVFLFAPASLFKYVYGFYIFTFLLIPLMGLELRAHLALYRLKRD